MLALKDGFAPALHISSFLTLYNLDIGIRTDHLMEIGLRMALGAENRQVSWLILKGGLAQLAIGLALGLAGAIALTRVMRGSADRPSN